MEERRRGGRGRWWQGEREVWEGNEGMIVVVLVVVFEEGNGSGRRVCCC